MKIIKRRKINEKRDLINGLRLDRHEKVDNWDKKIFLDIINNQKNYIFGTHPNLSNLYKFISRLTKIPEKNILVTSGVEGGIKCLFETFTKKNDLIVFPNPTFMMYEVYSSAFHTKPLRINFDTKFKLNLEKIEFFLKKKPKIFFLPNPNSPIEGDLTKKEIISLIKKARKVGCLFVIDEAYHGFGSDTFVEYIKSFDNLIILRSFSKSFGLPSIRLGYMVSNKTIIEKISQKRPAYETNVFSSIVSEYFIKNIKIVKKYNSDIIKSRKWLTKKLNDLNIFNVASKSIQVLIKFDKNVNKIVSLLEKRKIYVKGPLKNPYENCIVITIGSKKKMNFFVTNLAKILKSL